MDVLGAIKNGVKGVFDSLALTIYDFEDTVFVIDDIVIGSIVALEFNFDVSKITKVKGFNGENSYMVGRDTGGSIRLKVFDTSQANDYLSAKCNITGENKRTFKANFTESNKNSLSIRTSGCLIERQTNISKGTEVSEIEYVIYFSESEVNANSIPFQRFTNKLF